MKEKFLHSRTPSHSGVCGKFGISEGNITGGGGRRGTQNAYLTATAEKRTFPQKALT